MKEVVGRKKDQPLSGDREAFKTFNQKQTSAIVKSFIIDFEVKNNFEV